MLEQLNKISSRYQVLQDEACNMLEKCDGKAGFSTDTWTKDIGHGLTRVISGGEKIWKGAINFSKVSGPLNEKMLTALGVKAQQYAATGVSSIFHGHNPFVPTIHMNVRYFAFDNGSEWFGGGIDLSPVYIIPQQAQAFHRQLKSVCDKYHHSFYPNFKQQADDYFFLKHRNETRGVGGIFFDRQQPSEQINVEKWLAFTSELTELYPRLYTQLIDANHDKPYTAENSKWQKIRWSRYAEFNLVFDRGTKFGLESGGNTESILVSLPPEVHWQYQFQAPDNSPERQTQQLLKKNIDWLNIHEHTHTAYEQ